MKKITLALLVGAALNSGIVLCQKPSNTATHGTMQISLSKEPASKESEFLPGMKNPPQAGTKAEFTYTPKNGLEKAKDIKGLVYSYEDYKWKLEDVEMTQQGAVYTCSYQIPKDCAFLAFKFYANTPEGIIYDTNQDQGYIFTTVDSENQKVPGSNVAWGTFRNSNFNTDFGQYFKEFSASDEASEFWIKKEIQEHPENFPHFVEIYFQLAKIRKPEKFDTIAHVLARQFLNTYTNLTEGQYAKLYNLYAFDLMNKKLADSLQDVILKRFPKGRTAQLKAFQAASQISDQREKVKQFEAFLQEYPATELKGEQPFFYRTIYNFLVEDYFNTNEYDKLKALLPQLNFANLIEGYHFTISKAYHFKTVPLPVLNDLSQVIIAELLTKLDDASYVQGLYTSPQQGLANAHEQLDRKLKVQMRIAADLNKPDEVIRYGDYRSAEAKYTDSEINEIYIKALLQEQKDVTQQLEAAAANQALTPELKELLKEIYTAKKGSDVGFDAHLDSFKNKSLKAAIKSKLIDVKTPELVFEKSDGKEIRISSNAKIIILDFWANWCAPCKKSFPAMQQLVERYQNDKAVSFYFINTSETLKDYKEVTKTYFEKNHLDTMTVLFDKKAANARTNTMTFSKFASLFNSSGIPRKVIIKDGKIRYTAEGYSGNPDELKDEITTAIELLKSENGYD